MEKEPLYLIPYDFTPVSESALRLGLDLAEANKGKVFLLEDCLPNIPKNLNLLFNKTDNIVKLYEIIKKEHLEKE